MTITKDRMRADIAQMLHMDAEDLRDDDNLPDLGLDSLRLMKLVLGWEEAGLQADFGVFAEHGTLGEWWQAIEAQRAA
jgi:aryl carrier-like protein